MSPKLFNHLSESWQALLSRDLSNFSSHSIGIRIVANEDGRSPEGLCDVEHSRHFAFPCVLLMLILIYFHNYVVGQVVHISIEENVWFEITTDKSSALVVDEMVEGRVRGFQKVHHLEFLCSPALTVGAERPWSVLL